MSRRRQSGNVFFALLAAVGLVGVLGASLTTFITGPAATMVTVTNKSKADTQMQIATRLAVVEAVHQGSGGDCDDDGTIEPLPPQDTGGSPAPLGGGHLPAALGAAQLDPWGTPYGYCAWNHGALNADNGCSANLLAGTNYPDARTRTALAIISAGPDRRFDTMCGPHPVYVDRNGDDLVMAYTYAEAIEASGGLWVLKSGEPSTATINRDVEVQGAFRMGIAGETQGTVGAGACGSPEHINRMRYNSFDEKIEVCSFVSPNYVWRPISSLELWTLHENQQDIFYTGGNVGIGTSDPLGGLEVHSNGAIARMGAPTSHINLMNGVPPDQGGAQFSFVGGDIDLVRSDDDPHVWSAGIRTNSFSDSHHALFAGRRARGVISAPEYLRQGDPIVYFRGVANIGLPGVSNSTDIGFFADDDHTETSTPTRMAFRTVPSGSRSGLERMRITSEGNVGIGTNDPAAKLDINGAMRAYNDTSDPNAAGNTVIGSAITSSRPDDSATRTHMAFHRRDIGSSYPNNHRFILQSTGTSGGDGGIQELRWTYRSDVSPNTEIMSLHSDGRVGIGISNPQSVLHVGAINDDFEDVQEVRVESRGYAGVAVLGDRNNAGGEPGGAYLRLGIDNQIVQGLVAVLQQDTPEEQPWGELPEGVHGNSMFVGNTFKSGSQNLGLLHLGANNQVHMSIRRDGNVGIGTTSPQQKLHVNGTIQVPGMWLGKSSNVGVAPDIHMNVQGLIAADSTLHLMADGDGSGSGDIMFRAGALITPGSDLLVRIMRNGDTIIYGSGTTCTIGNSTGATMCSSDARLKQDVETVSDALENISSLRGVRFRWNDTARFEDKDKHHLGFIAQEIKEIFPEAVEEDEEGFLMVASGALIPPLVEAVKELKSLFDQLIEKLEALVGRVNMLSQHNDRQDAIIAEQAAIIAGLETANRDVLYRLENLEAAYPESCH